MSDSRSTNSIKNSVVSFACQILTILFSFANRTVFIRLFNADYLGVSGLFSNILSVLSLAELGVGTAIIYAMYKPAAENDTKKLAAYLNYYRNIYTLIGIFIFTAGLALIPFLDRLIKNVPNIQENITLIYVLVLLDTSVSYFFTYKKSILLVYQKNRIAQIISTAFILIRYLLQIIGLLVTRNYYVYLLLQVVITIISNLTVSIIVDKQYPFVRIDSQECLDKNEKKSVKKNVLAMTASKIGSVAVNGTDNLLISAYIGVTAVGVYSNYIYLVNYTKVLLSSLFTSLTSSVGNLIALSDKQKIVSIYRQIYFINFIVAFLSTSLLYNLIDPFISVWIGDTYIVKASIKTLVVANYYIGMLRITQEIFINSYGLFWQIKWKPLVEAGVNLLVSWLLVAYTDLGILGIVIGTIVSNIGTNLWWEPYVVYRYGFHANAWTFYMRYLADGLICMANVLIVERVTNLFPLFGMAKLVINFFVCITITSIVIIVCYGWTKDFAHSVKLVLNSLTKKS